MFTVNRLCIISEIQREVSASMPYTAFNTSCVENQRHMQVRVQLVPKSLVMNWAGALDILDKNKASRRGVKNHIIPSSFRRISQGLYHRSNIYTEFRLVTKLTVSSIAFGNIHAIRKIPAKRVNQKLHWFSDKSHHCDQTIRVERIMFHKTMLYNESG